MKENMSLTSPQVLERVEFFTQSLIGKVDNPELAAMQLLDNVVSREAFIIAINNVFGELFKTGGYEQPRNANYPELKQDKQLSKPIFGPKYWYGNGASYYINVYVRL